MLGTDYAAPIQIRHAEHLELCLCVIAVEECLIETNDHTSLEREKMFFEDIEIKTQELLVSSKKERKKKGIQNSACTFLGCHSVKIT
jgi:hypothetical protein